MIIGRGIFKNNQITLLPRLTTENQPREHLKQSFISL